MLEKKSEEAAPRKKETAPMAQGARPAFHDLPFHTRAHVPKFFFEYINDYLDASRLI
jgi:hypothetical protein